MIRAAPRLLDGLVARLPRIAAALDGFPYYGAGKGARWITVADGGWVGGFWAGLLWLSWAWSGASAARQLAEEWTARLAPRRLDRTTHDLGFLFEPSCVRAWRLTQDPQYRAWARDAATTLSSRVQPAGYLPAHGVPEDTRTRRLALIDTLMNLPLLWWAAREGAPAAAEAADRHLTFSLQAFFRPDGSTWQVVHVDPVSGTVQERGTLQGAGPGSCWSRGQAWAIYGCARAFAETRHAEALAGADAAARYFLDHLPADGVPAWDFAAAGRAPKDTSAGAVAAAGLLLLASHHPAPGIQRRYRDAAYAMLSALETWLLPDDAYGLLGGGCYFLARGEGVDEPCAWGDYYLVEALLRAAGHAAVQSE